MVTKQRTKKRNAQHRRRIQARFMRHEPGYCELLLWNALRDRKLGGFKFKRQHLVGNYIVDFICIEIKLIVELDGGVHKLKREDDSVRGTVLKTLGYRVLRFSNEEYTHDPAVVLRTITEALTSPHRH